MTQSSAMIKRRKLSGDVLQATTMTIVPQVHPIEVQVSYDRTGTIPSKKSGHSDEDILRLAYEKYREESNGIAFNLEHVWRIVKDRPMFTPQSVDHLVSTKKARTSESGASNTSSNQDASLHVDLNEEENRPMGQKAAKRKRKGKMRSDMECMTTNLDNMFAKFTEYTSMKKVEVEMKQKQLEVEEMKAKAAMAKVQLKEYAILSKDTSQMTYEQLIIHERLCQEIRGRWNI
ncbi:uncharacterized protein LOC142523980 [Primulina tabacum]|uniref:uncharacterized protein LOC142523980 n=1 Tax=Primulina tabacum TaxID=48773 RepID=UPI003F594CAD